jgi:hypothetical protein
MAVVVTVEGWCRTVGLATLEHRSRLRPTKGAAKATWWDGNQRNNERHDADRQPNG